MTFALTMQEAAAIFGGALLLAFAWRAVRRVAARYRRARWARQQHSRADLLALSPNEFEALTAAAFESFGWRVEIIGREGRADGGLDLLLFKRGRRVVAQCKRYAGKVGAPVVREIIGVMVHHKAQGAYVVALSGFTKAAQQWAEGKRCLRLIDGQQLLGAIHHAGQGRAGRGDHRI